MTTISKEASEPALLRIFRDPAGDLRAEDVSSRGKRKLLIAFLESEVQGSVAAGREILGEVASVVAGERVRGRWIGNAHTLSIGRKTVKITDENDASGASLRLSLSDLYSALDAWLDVLEAEDDSNGGNPPR